MKDVYIADVFCGKHHSYVYVNEKIIAFGYDDRGRVGIGNIDEALITPLIVPYLSVIIHFLFIEYYSWTYY